MIDIVNEEQPHEENSLDEILQLRGLRSSMKSIYPEGKYDLIKYKDA